MICKGCEEERKLIKAHVIPESFFRGLKDGEKAPKIHSNTKGVYPKRAPIGVYDNEILCHECEQKFQDLDSYGYQVLIKNESDLEPLSHAGRIVGYLINSIDYQKLKLFFLSILWRASISKHYFYSKVALGKLESQLKQLIWSNNSGNSHDFSFVLAKFDGDGVGRTILDPHSERWFGLRYYRFYLYGYILYIKADSQITPSVWAKFISDNESIIVIDRGIIENAKEYPLLVAAAQKHQK